MHDRQSAAGQHRQEVGGKDQGCGKYTTRPSVTLRMCEALDPSIHLSIYFVVPDFCVSHVCPANPEDSLFNNKFPLICQCILLTAFRQHALELHLIPAACEARGGGGCGRIRKGISGEFSRAQSEERKKMMHKMMMTDDAFDTSGT